MYFFPNEKRIRTLLNQLDNPDKAVKANKNLFVIKNFLIDKMQDNRPIIRETAACTLGIIKAPDSVDPLIKVLSDDNLEVRLAAINALASINDHRAIEPLIEMLASDNNIECNAAVNALCMIKSPQLVYLVIDLLNSSSNKILGAAIRILGELGDKCAIKPLRKLLIITNPYIRRETVEALGNLGESGWTEIIERPFFNLLLNCKEFEREPTALALENLGFDEWAILLGPGEEALEEARKLGLDNLIPYIMFKIKTFRFKIWYEKDRISEHFFSSTVNPLISLLSSGFRYDIRKEAAQAILSIARQNHDFRILTDEVKELIRQPHMDELVSANHDCAHVDEGIGLDSKVILH